MQKRLFAFIFVHVFSQPLFADELLLSEIAAATRARGVIDGRFLQCSHHSDIVVPSTGHYHADPTGRLIWNIETPRRKRIEFTRDGNLQGGGTLRGNQRFNRQTSILAALLRLDEKRLERTFDIAISGDMSAYVITMVPTTRLGKVLRSAIIHGHDGGIDTVQLNFASDRKVTLALRPNDASVKHECTK